jgi:uncharacterized membrane protein YkoI
MSTTQMQRDESHGTAMRRLVWACAVLAGLALASPLAAATPTTGASQRILSVDHAEKIAASKLPFTYPVDATLETVDGRKVYDVDLTVDERLIVRHVILDAHTGKIMRIYTTRAIDDPVWIGGGGGL